MIRILLLLLFPIVTFGQNVLLSGYIKDGKTDEPVENARVRLYMGGAIGELSAYTKADGYYEISSKGKPVNRDYAFTIQKDGYQRVNGVIKLNFGNEPLRNYALYPSSRQEVVVNTQEARQEQGPSLLGAPTNNLTFLIDISGSMGEENRLENLKKSLSYLLQQFRPEDKISIVTYSSFPKVLLDQGSVAEMDEIEAILKKLRAGGQSKGTDGLKMAYDLAMVNHKAGGNNKIILATDGYFGMDKRSQTTIEELISKGLTQGVKLSIFAFGKKDKETEDRLETWCTAGAGYYTNITSLEAAKDQIIKEAKGR